MNVIVHKKLLTNVTCEIDAVNNSGAAISETLFMEKFDDMKFGHVLSSDQQTIALFVHQYDRYSELLDDVSKVCEQSQFPVSNFARRSRNQSFKRIIIG